MPSPLPSTREGVQAQRAALRSRPDRRLAPGTQQGRPLQPREQALRAAMRALRTVNPQIR